MTTTEADLQGFMDGLHVDAAARPAEYTQCVLSDKGVVHVPTCVLRRHSPVLAEFLSTSEGGDSGAGSTLELVETTRPFAQFVAAIFPDLERLVHAGDIIRLGDVVEVNLRDVYETAARDPAASEMIVGLGKTMDVPLMLRYRARCRVFILMHCLSLFSLFGISLSISLDL